MPYRPSDNNGTELDVAVEAQPVSFSQSVSDHRKTKCRGTMLESVVSDSVVAVLAVLGIYATLDYLIVNCRTPVGILCNYFATRRVSFPERYGPWAG